MRRQGKKECAEKGEGRGKGAGKEGEREGVTDTHDRHTNIPVRTEGEGYGVVGGEGEGAKIE